MVFYQHQYGILNYTVKLKEWGLSFKVKEAYISVWNIAKQWSELIDTIYCNSDDKMFATVPIVLLLWWGQWWPAQVLKTYSLYGPCMLWTLLYMLFQLALARYSLFKMMKLVVASQNILLDRTGIYGCHEKLSFTWRLFHATHKHQCLTKLWLLKDTVGCYSFSAGKQWTHVPANSVAFDLVLHLLSIRPLAIIGTFSVTFASSRFEVTVLLYHV